MQLKVALLSATISALVALGCEASSRDFGDDDTENAGSATVEPTGSNASTDSSQRDGGGVPNTGSDPVQPPDSGDAGEMMPPVIGTGGSGTGGESGVGGNGTTNGGTGPGIPVTTGGQPSIGGSAGLGGTMGLGGMMSLGGMGDVGGSSGSGGSSDAGGTGGEEAGMGGEGGDSSSAGAGGMTSDPECSGTMQTCGDGCIAASACCGGCSGNTPVCDDGTCVGRSQGDACTSDAVCENGRCEDGYCCNVVCDGQCEACDVPGNLGTCLPVTTPRTSCAGSGTCGGFCDGTAQNRDSCVFPSSATSCGAAASCTNGVLTSAATCNGAGGCTPGSAMSCMYGCRTDGTGCATMCPSNQDYCDGVCVNTDSNPDACGSSCEVCEGSTPKCSAGVCVECTVAADCPGTGRTCTAQNTCGCSVGYHACGTSTSPCYADTDVTRCGNGCTDCRQPNANAACGVGDLCANTCTSSLYTLGCPAVGGKPNCSLWNFESNTSEGWQFAPIGTASAAAGALVTSTAQQTAGLASLAIPFDNGGDVDKFVEIRVQLCAGGNVLDLTDKHVSWSFKMDPPSSGGYNYLILYAASNFGDASGVYDYNTDSDGVWDAHEYGFLPSVELASAIGFHLQATEDYNGTMYLDNIRIY